MLVVWLDWLMVSLSGEEVAYSWISLDVVSGSTFSAAELEVALCCLFVK